MVCDVSVTNIDEHFQIFSGFRRKNMAVPCVFAIGVVCWANLVLFCLQFGGVLGIVQ